MPSCKNLGIELLLVALFGVMALGFIVT